MMIDSWRPLENQQYVSLKNARSAYCYKMPVHDPWKTLQNDPLNPFFKKQKSPHSVEEMCRGIYFIHCYNLILFLATIYSILQGDALKQMNMQHHTNMQRDRDSVTQCFALEGSQQNLGPFQSSFKNYSFRALKSRGNETLWTMNSETLDHTGS